MFQQNWGRNITSCIHTPQCGVCIMCRALLWYDKKPAPDQMCALKLDHQLEKKPRRWREQMAFSCLTLSIWCFFFLHRGGVLMTWHAPVSLQRFYKRLPDGGSGTDVEETWLCMDFVCHSCLSLSMGSLWDHPPVASKRMTLEPWQISVSSFSME